MVIEGKLVAVCHGVKWRKAKNPSQVSHPLPITEVSATHLQEACHMNAYAMKQYQTVNVHAQVTE
ncbi:MAG TPA: hypothetical protein IAA18_05535, partial [Candidatus Pseudomonas excrementavium]|nr:hypothetical protein [Candidatus Pseudomonas excrementavium]